MNDEKPSLPGMAGDKFEVHYRQQLSALIDGELSPDEARFMLRRLQHDAELSGCHERWQLCGDVLRGQACAPAPLDFADRVAAAVAREPQPEHAGSSGPSGNASSGHAPRRWLRWGGGTALAASVAALAMFMSREQLPDTLPSADESAPVVASAQGPAPAPAPVPPPVQTPATPGDPDGTLGQVVAAAPAAALAVARRQEASARRTVAATRTQQAGRGAAARQSAPQQRTVAAAAPVEIATAAPADPFGHHAETLQARPWPRSVVAPSMAGGGVFNASVPAAGSDRTFYPFEPRMPADVRPAGADGDLPPLP